MESLYARELAMEAIMILDLATYDGGFRVTVYGPNRGTPVDRTTGHASRPFRSIDRAQDRLPRTTR